MLRIYVFKGNGDRIKNVAYELQIAPSPCAAGQCQSVREDAGRELLYILRLDIVSAVDCGICPCGRKESNCSASRNMPLPEPEVKRYSRWKTFVDRDIKVPKGWALDKESVRESNNPYTGYPRREYRLIRLGVRRC